MYTEKPVVRFDPAKSERNRHLLVFTPRGDALHVISLRKANRRERALYEAQTEIDATDGRES